MHTRKIPSSRNLRPEVFIPGALVVVVLGVAAIVLAFGAPAKQAATDESPSESDATKEPDTIPGLTPADILAHLDEWCIEFDRPQQILQFILIQGEGTDADTGIAVTCEIQEKTTGMDVTMVEFTVDAAALAQCQQVSPESVASLAVKYLGHCAALSYQGAEPEVAEEWVQRKVAEAVDRELTLIIGGVEFRLYGTDLVKALQLCPVSEE